MGLYGPWKGSREVLGVLVEVPGVIADVPGVFKSLGRSRSFFQKVPSVTIGREDVLEFLRTF